VPTDAEWTVLTDYLGGEAVAGGKLKSTRTDPDPHPRWDSPNSGATNESNWHGYPGGIRDYMGYYWELGAKGNWWSSTDYYVETAWSRTLSYSDPSILPMSDYFVTYGLSIRCVEDQ
jgi:uncharacterized protein (TIGR02145 family)